MANVPKLRFKGFDDEWETVKLKDIVSIPDKIKIKTADNYKLLTVKLHCKGIEVNDSIKPKITKKGRPYFIRNKDELLIGRQNFHNGGIGIVPSELDGGICSNAISSFKNNPSIADLKYLYYFLSRKDYYKRAEKLVGGTGQKEFTEKDLLSLDILLPTLKEQTKIGIFLSSIDNKIDMLKQQLIQAKNFKKYLMQNIFAQKLRFAGFEDEWEEVKLDDVATFSKGKGISKKNISKEGVECIRYGELYTKYGEIINNVDSKTDLNKNDLILSRKNDILIPCSGETAIDLATASCITKEGVAIGGDITIIKTNQYAPFITYYLNQKKTEIAKFAQGVSIVHLYSNDFKDINLKIPSFEEQEKIVAVLSKIDNKIKLVESHIKEAELFKQAMLEKMFI